MIKRQELHPTLSRTSPAIFFYLAILNCMISPSYQSFYLFVSYCSILGSNWIIKHLLVKPIYKLLNTTKLPILGIGSRPDKAESCHFTLNNVLAMDYGMPSGHSQMAWAIATYFILKIIKNVDNNENNDNKKNRILQYLWLILSSLVIFIIAVYISYSRVYIEGCHTIQQVTVGGLLGIFCGLLIYYFENDIIKLMSKIY